MALANVAESFYNAGSKVLMVDWDLEAPGLERFFEIDYNKTIDSPGIIDMVQGYKKIMSKELREGSGLESVPFEKLDQFLIDVYPNSYRDGNLWLLPAGRRSKEHFSEYASAVLNFNWFEFYQKWDGELYFEWLRRQFLKKADVVLIDSRTGVTEMGGVCTYQLADAVVMFCAPNQQNLHGINEMAKNFKMSHVKDLRRGRPLDLIIVPARVEDRAEAKLLNNFHDVFVKTFSRYLPEKIEGGPEEFWKLKIPHVPYYAFNEVVAVREKGEIRSEDLVKAYASLARMMSRIIHSFLIEFLSNNNDFNEELAICHSCQGIFAKDSGDFKDADEFFMKSINFGKKVKDKTCIIKSYIEYAKLAKIAGKLEESNKIFKNIEKMIHQNDDKSGWVGLLLQLAYLAEEIGRVEEAKKYYDLCLAIESRSGNMSKAKEWYFELARLAIEKNDFASANSHFKLIRDIFIKAKGSPEMDDLDQCLLNLEHIAFKKQNPELIQEWLRLYMDFFKLTTIERGDSEEFIEKGLDKLERDLGHEELSKLLVIYLDYQKSKNENKLKNDK